MRYIRLACMLLMLMLCVFPASAAETEVFSDQSATTLPASNDELFELHFEREIYGMGEISTFGTSSRDSLTPRQQKLYDYFKINVQRVANGSTANAYFSITGAQTLYDMGYPAIASYRTQTEKDAVREYFRQQLFDDFHIVCDAIRFDCPYDLYWHAGSMRISYSGYHSNNTYYVDTVTLTFDVDVKYRSASYTQDRPTVNTYLTNAASMVTHTARNIVSKYAWNTDYDKLKGYKNEICNMVSYDYDAANDTTGTYDGGAWDLIYVFDNDPYTNVVCEGYAKAFQYLCDLTVFNSDKIECRTVNGYTSGRHRWNIVTMEDGWNYLVDVTNSDTGMSGQYGDLFLTAKATYDAYNKRYTFYYRNHSLSYTYNDDLPYAPEDLLLAETAAVYNPVYGNYTQSGSRVISSGECLTVVGGVYTVPAGVTLTNNGVINLVDGASLNVLGYLRGSGTVLQPASSNYLDPDTGIYYINGKPSNYTGMVDYNGGSFFVVNGRLNRNANGLTLVGDKFLFLAYGQLQVHHGFALYDGEWFYLDGGELDLNATGIYEYDGGLFVIAVGRLVSEYTGLAEVDSKWYFVVNGQVQTQYTGYLDWNGVKYLIVRGQMIRSVSNYSELDASLSTLDLNALLLSTPSDLPGTPVSQKPVVISPASAQTVTAFAGQTATMTVVSTNATGYQWFINRQNGRGFVPLSGATSASYTTSVTEEANTGFQYYCRLSNAQGNTVSPTFTLDVKAATEIPSTGDSARPVLWLAMLVLSAGCMAALLVLGKRRASR